MFSVQLFLTIIYLFCSKKIPHTLLRGILLFFVLLLSFQILGNLYDYQMINNISYYSILIFNMNIIFFIFGSWLFVFSKKTVSSYKINQNINTLPNINILIIIQFFLLIIVFYYYNKFSSIISMTTDSARQLFFEANVLFGSGVEQFFYNYFISGYRYIASFIFAYLFLQKKLCKKEVLLAFMSIAYIYMLSAISQGRLEILTPILFTFFYSIYLKTVQPILYSKSVKLKLIIVTIVSIVAIGFVSLIRISVSVSLDNLLINLVDVLIYPMIDYFSFPVTAFDYGINSVFLDTPLMFGMATFAGLEELILTPARFFDNTIMLTNIYLGSIMSPAYNINDQDWNALYTGIINYYLDFSFLGVIIYPTFLGYILGKLSMSIQKNNNIFNMQIYFLFLYCLFKNLISSPFQSLGTWTAILLLLVFRKLFIKNIKLSFN